MADRDPVGLKSIRDAKQNREKQARVTPQHLLFLLLSAVTVTIIYFYVAGRSLDANKDKLLQKQRAVQATVGAEWGPLRDRIEKATLDAAAQFKGDFVDSEAGRMEFRTAPGIYLRMRVTDGKDAAGLRKAARTSLKDSFVGCLLRGQPRAKVEADGGGGGLFPDQPWNMRQAYTATRILTDDWVNEVKASDDDLRLRVFQQQYEQAIRDEIPLAIEMLKKAQFFLLVLDEDAAAARAAADGGPVDEQALQLVPHETRVHLLNLKTGAEMLRLKRSGSATFFMAGENPNVDPETRAAMQRNVNNCDLANQVTTALEEKK
jgi:hypothetical protein